MKTRGYFAFYRAWHAHWPFAAGKQVPGRLSRVFSPFVPIWVRVEPGMTMRFDPYDALGSIVLSSGDYEPGTVHELLRHVPAGGTLVDVGAHAGWYSASGAGAVVAAAPVACSDSETTPMFHAAAHGNTGESSLSSTNASQERAIAASYPVRARRLDDIVREAGVDRVDTIAAGPLPPWNWPAGN